MKNEYFQITMDGSGQKVYFGTFKEAAEYLEEDLKGSNTGTKFGIQIVEMEDEVFEKMGEFEGW